MVYKGNTPSFAHAAITFLAIVMVIGIGLFGFNVSLHSLMLVCLTIAAISAWLLNKDGFGPIRAAMNEGISSAFGAIYIFYSDWRSDCSLHPSGHRGNADLLRGSVHLSSGVPSNRNHSVHLYVGRDRHKLGHGGHSRHRIDRDW